MILKQNYSPVDGIGFPPSVQTDVGKCVKLDFGGEVLFMRMGFAFLSLFDGIYRPQIQRRPKESSTCTK